MKNVVPIGVSMAKAGRCIDTVNEFFNDHGGMTNLVAQGGGGDGGKFCSTHRPLYMLPMDEEPQFLPSEMLPKSLFSSHAGCLILENSTPFSQPSHRSVRPYTGQARHHQNYRIKSAKPLSCSAPIFPLIAVEGGGSAGVFLDLSGAENSKGAGPPKLSIRSLLSDSLPVATPSKGMKVLDGNHSMPSYSGNEARSAFSEIPAANSEILNFPQTRPSQPKPFGGAPKRMGWYAGHWFFHEKLMEMQKKQMADIIHKIPPHGTGATGKGRIYRSSAPPKIRLF